MKLEADQHDPQTVYALLAGGEDLTDLLVAKARRYALARRAEYIEVYIDGKLHRRMRARGAA